MWHRPQPETKRTWEPRWRSSRQLSSRRRRITHRPVTRHEVTASGQLVNLALHAPVDDAGTPPKAGPPCSSRCASATFRRAPEEALWAVDDDAWWGEVLTGARVFLQEEPPDLRPIMRARIEQTWIALGLW